MWIPKHLTGPTSARDWYTMVVELGERVVDAIRCENPYGRIWR